MCVCVCVCVRVCRGRAGMAGGLALTPLCVLIQHRGRVSGVKGSVGGGKVVAGDGGDSTRD